MTAFTVAFLVAAPVGSQEILTAASYLDSVADRYGVIDDYIADVEMATDEEQMAGTLYYRRPNLIRIDFEEPQDQVLVSDGETLTVYIPRFDVVLQQALRERTSDGADLASERGLQLMRQNYSVAYLESPDPVPIEEDSDELVVKLRLDWRSTSEQFRQLTLSVTEDRLIRRIVGVTVDYREVQFDFTDIRVNQNIPPARFEYEPPASANVFDGFLFDNEG